MKKIETEEKNLTEEEIEKARDDIAKAPRRGLRNALVTLAGVAVFAAFIVASGLTWGFTLPTLSFAASWGLLGAGVTWGVGFWANRKQRLLKKAQRQKKVQKTGKHYKREQNLTPEAVATNNKNLEKSQQKLLKRKNGKAYVAALNENEPADAEAEKASDETIKFAKTRDDNIGELESQIVTEAARYDDVLTDIDVEKVEKTNGGLFLQCGSDEIASMPVKNLKEVGYTNELEKKACYFRTLKAINEASDLCFPVNVVTFREEEKEGKTVRVEESVSFDNANSKELIAALDSARNDYEDYKKKCKERTALPA